jgi:hypothetical protein
MTLIKQLLGESGATAFKPERAAAFVEEFRSGKRILVLTAKQAELVQSREDLRQFKGPFVAFSLRELVSANYDGADQEHPTQFSSGTAPTSPVSPPDSSPPSSGSVA